MKSRRILTLGDFLSRALVDLQSMDWRAVLMAEPCVYCGGKAQGLDHIVARSMGGVDALAINRAPACTACDSKKANTPMLHFLVSRRGIRIMPWPKAPSHGEPLSAKAKRKADEKAARRELRRQYREMSELAFSSGTFGARLSAAIQRTVGALDEDR